MPGRPATPVVTSEATLADAHTYLFRPEIREVRSLSLVRHAPGCGNRHSGQTYETSYIYEALRVMCTGRVDTSTIVTIFNDFEFHSRCNIREIARAINTTKYSKRTLRQFLAEPLGRIKAQLNCLLIDASVVGRNLSSSEVSRDISDRPYTVHLLSLSCRRAEGDMKRTERGWKVEKKKLKYRKHGKREECADEPLAGKKEKKKHTEERESRSAIPPLATWHGTFTLCSAVPPPSCRCHE